MSRRKTEPVRHTCPDIDRIITTITSICNQMERCDNTDDKDDLLININDWLFDLKNIGVGKWCELENLRASNSALRDWGNEMYNEAEQMEIERDRFEQLYECEKEKVEELNNHIKELEL